MTCRVILSEFLLQSGLGFHTAAAVRLRLFQTHKGTSSFYNKKGLWHPTLGARINSVCVCWGPVNRFSFPFFSLTPELKPAW